MTSIVVAALSACGTAADRTEVDDASAAVRSSPTSSSSETSTGRPGLTAPRAGWSIGLPAGWVAVNRDELRALDDASVAQLATTMNVDPGFLERFTELEPFEAYAADPENRRELRVVFGPQRLLPGRETVEALIEPFDGSVDSSTSVRTPAGNLAVTFFQGGDTVNGSFGALIMGSGADASSTIVLYLFAESPAALKTLLDEVAPRLRLTA